MFGHTAQGQCKEDTDARSVAQADDEYMISDVNLALTKYISVPRDMGSFNPGALAAGIVKGILDAADFPAR